MTMRRRMIRASTTMIIVTMAITTMTTTMMVEALVPSSAVHHSSSSSSFPLTMTTSSSISSGRKDEDLSSTLPALSSIEVKQRKESKYKNNNDKNDNNNHNNYNNIKNMQRRKQYQQLQKQKMHTNSGESGDNTTNSNIDNTKRQNDDSLSNNNNQRKTNVNRNNNNNNNNKGTTTGMTTTTTIRKLPESIPNLSDILAGRVTFQYNGGDNDEAEDDTTPTSTTSPKTKTDTDTATVVKRKIKNVDSATTTTTTTATTSETVTTKTATVKIENSDTTAMKTTATAASKKKSSSEPKTKVVPIVKTGTTVTAEVNNKKKLSSSSSSSSSSSPPPRKLKKRVEALPWRASYHSSKRTQGRIKKAFEYSSSSLPSQQRGSHAHFRAQRVLDELLDTPPQYCNAVNLVCALTYSAKAMGGQDRHQKHYNDNNNNKANNDKANLYLRKSLQETFDILHDLLVIHREEKLFTPRQLCNVCWAIAKHYDRDPDLILPSSQSSSTLTSTSSSGKKKEEVWDWASLLNEENIINDDDKKDDVDVSSQLRLAQTIDEIARQLTVILFQEDEKEIEADHVDVQDGLNVKKKKMKKTFQQPKIKLGEICMACWAYGKLKPRETPPGWPEPPQMARVTTAMTTSTTTDNSPTTSANNNDINMSFESFGSFGKGSANKIIANNDNNSNTNNNGDRKAVTVTDMLFDAIGYALCQSNDDKYDEVSHLDHYDTEPTIMLLEDCTWSELANVGWAFASHGRCRSRESELLLKSLAEEASNRLKDDGTIANNNNKNNQNFLVRDISQLLWTLGTLQADNFRLGDGLVVLVESLSANLRLGTKTGSRFVQGRPLRSWSCADLVQTAVALAHARIDEKLLLTAVYEEGNYRLMEGASNNKSSSSSLTPSLVERTSRNGRLSGDDRRTFHPWEASVLLWAQARLYLTEQEGVEFDEFTEDAPLFFLKALREKRGSFTECRIGPQEQANIVWSLVTLEKYHSTEAIILIDLIFAEAARSCKKNRSIQLEHAHQLWQAYFMLEEDCPEAVKRIPKWFVTYLKGKWSIEKARDKKSSARHRSLSSTLQLMGVDHINEHDEDIDVAIILQPNAQWVHETDMDDEITDSVIDGEEDHVSVAVEFDGPNHFTRVRINDDEPPAAGAFPPSRPDPPRALGHTVLKYRLLKKQGWTVVRVPYYEFDKIPFWASMERQRYLQRKLKTHANINFSEVDVSEYKELTPDFKSRFD